MKELPLIAKPHEVRAILAETMTAFSRPIKPQPYIDKMGNFCWDGNRPPIGPSPKERLAVLYKSIYGEEVYASNLWMWVVSFKIISTTGKPA